ncbi:MAG: hypothetical protein R3D85_08160 [Paracoccaceae bacterium]
MFAPAVDWLCDAAGDLLVDAVFDISTLKDHWPDIAGRAGVETGLDWHNATAARYTPAEAARMLSPASRRIVERHFEDFNRFGYDSPA